MDEVTFLHHFLIVSLLCPCDDYFMVELRRLLRIFEYNLGRMEDVSDQDGLHVRIFGFCRGQLLWLTGSLSPVFDAVEAKPKRHASELAIALAVAEGLRLEHCVTSPLASISYSVTQEAWKATQVLAELVQVASSSGVLRGMETIVAEVLIDKSANVELVSRLCPLLEESFSATLRDANGVDMDSSSLASLFSISRATAYIERPLYNSVSYKARHTWEVRFLDGVSYAGRIAGKQCRNRADADTVGGECGANGPALHSEILDLLRALSFCLADRVQWADSYMLPEKALPFIVHRLARTVVESSTEDASWFVDALHECFGYQYGMYSEGYRATLCTVAATFSLSPALREQAQRVWGMFLDHVTRTVFARRERIQALLECCKGALRLEDVELGRSAFREVVKASLGPDWYKEDQFSLLVSALPDGQTGGRSKERYLSVLNFLELASGESTFQRYVRYHKQDFVAKLIKSGQFFSALSLFRHYYLPRLDVQLSRLHRYPNDRVSEIEVGRFGVAEVEEQAGLAALTDGLSEATELRRWAVLEIAIPLDERYLSDLGGVLEELLESPFCSTIGKRFLRMLRVDVHPKRRRLLMLGLIARKHRLRLLELARQAEELGIFSMEGDDSTESMILGGTSGAEGFEEVHEVPTALKDSPPSATGDELFLDGIIGRVSAYDLLRLKVAQGKKLLNEGATLTGRKSLVQGLRDAQQGGWTIWHGVPEASEALRLLFETGPHDDTLKMLSEIVVTEGYARGADVASSLIGSAFGSLAPDEQGFVFSLVEEHASAILKPEIEHIGLGDELQFVFSEDNELDANTAVETLLVHLLDHPCSFTRERVADVIWWLLEVGQFDVERLVSRVFAPELDYGREAAVGILNALLVNSPVVSSQILSAAGGRSTQNSLLVDALSLMAPEGGPLETLDAPSGSPMAGDQSYQWPEHFVKLFMVHDGLKAKTWENLNRVSAPLTPQQLQKLWAVRRQSFGDPRDPRGSPHEREALFMSIAGKEKATSRVRGLRSWNPMWSSQFLRADASSFGLEILSRFDSQSFRDMFLFGGDLLFHCYDLIVDDDFKCLTVEAIALFVGPTFDGSLDWSQVVAMAVCDVDGSTLADIETSLHTFEPAVRTFAPTPGRMGGDITPALPSARFLDIFGTSVPSRICWRDGRTWRPGPGNSLSRGAALLYPEREAFRFVDIAWAVAVNDSLLFVVDPTQRRIWS